MHNLFTKYSPTRSNRGFIIFVVTGIVAILGLTLISLNWMTRQQNVQSHKSLYNETARISAEAGLQLLIRAIREGIQTPSEADIERISKTRNYHEKSFYGFFLQSTDSLVNPLVNNQLNHPKIMDLFPKNLKIIHENYQKMTPGLNLEYLINLESNSLYSNIEGGHVLQDQVEKKLNLELICAATYLGTTKKFRLKKSLIVYNLISPIISKFTFFHKSSIGNRYNKLVTNLLGKPILNEEGDFKYKYNFPLILINGPVSGNSKTPVDSILLSGKGGVGFENMTHLSDKEELDRSKAAILERGFLYFGPGDENFLKLTPGSDPAGWGEYFHLFNPYIGKNPNTYPAQIINSPEFFQQSQIVRNGDPINSETQGSAILQSVYEGFYEPDFYVQNRPDPSHYILSGYSAFSSLIHPFGSYLAFSRAYTVGNAYRSIVKISSVGVDRIDTPNDEMEQAVCLEVDSVQQRDGRMAILKEATIEGWEGSREFTLTPLTRTMDNLHKMRPVSNGPALICEGEPQTIIVGPEFNYDSMFSGYEEYANFMSRVERLPINHTLDYPHFTHEVIPPNDHQSFKQFMFPPHEKERLYESADDNSESWSLAPSEFTPQGSLYLQGNPDDFNVDEFRAAHQYYSLKNSSDGNKSLQEEGFLKISSGHYVLNTQGQLLKIDGNLTFDRKVIVEDHSALLVTGICSLEEILSNYYFSLQCGEISFRDSDRGTGYNVDGFLNAERAISKENPMTPISIQGGIAMQKLDFTMFQAPTTVIYDMSYSPLESNYKFFYRMVMDDHNREWQAQI